MLVGASVLAFLVLLLLLAERGGEFMWQAQRGDARFYCTPCDLRYRVDELSDTADRVCPRGHHVDALPKGFSLGTVAIVTCITFIALAGVLTATGTVPVIH
jgi:hypothetical protein